MSYTFFMPVKIIAGSGCVRDNAALFSSLGKKALIVTSPSSRKNGALDDVLAALASQNMTYAIFDRCENNPSLAFANELGKFAFASGCDLVVGIGGGSALDSAKAACVLAVNDMPAEELFKNAWPNPALPLIAIPTTAGTGSEVTYNAVLTIDGGTNKKSFGDTRLHAKYALLDGRYTEALPMTLTRNTALDAFAHALEGYLSCKATPAGTLFAREVFRIFAKNYPALKEGKLTPAQREELLYNATYAGIVIAQERTIALHSMSYPLTALRGVQHGLAVSLPMAAFVEFCYPGAKERIDELLSILGLSDISDLSEYIGALIEDKNTYTSDEIEHFIAICGKGACGRNNPVQMTEEDIRRIYHKSLHVVG